MKATFVYAIRYQIVARCISPLRSGNGENDTEALLRDQTGYLMLQGSSIAGAMRNWAAKQNTDFADVLFGTCKQPGSLIVSDGIFHADTETELRPRLRIDRNTGAAADKAKFDMLGVAVGSVFDFTLTVLCKTAPEQAAQQVEQLLSAIQNGEIAFGGQRSNGFGMVRLTVKKREFDLRSESGRIAWLEDAPAEVPCVLPENSGTRGVRFVLRGVLPAVLVRSGNVETLEENGQKLTVSVNLRSDGRPVIPGSSVKGVLRSQSEAICGYLGLDDGLVTELYGKAADTAAEPVAGNAIFHEVIMPKAEAVYHAARIRVDRFTGGVIHGALMQEQPVTGKAELRIDLRQEQSAACGLLFYTLRDLAEGRINLGSGGSIGRGLMEHASLEMTTPQGQVKITFAETPQVTGDEQLLIGWLNALEEVSAHG